MRIRSGGKSYFIKPGYAKPAKARPPRSADWEEDDEFYAGYNQFVPDLIVVIDDGVKDTGILDATGYRSW